MDVYDIVSKSGLNVAKFIQDRFRDRGIPINIWSNNAHEDFMGSVICQFPCSQNYETRIFFSQNMPENIDSCTRHLSVDQL